MIGIRGITKRFGGFQALDELSLDIGSGELVALLGPSGSGKTTLLRIIAGLEHADAGDILFDGESTTDLSARERQVGFVFQHFALFRHMTVAQNIAFGLTVKERRLRPSKAEIAAKVEDLLQKVQLAGLGGRYPSQLSGGQRQRVALARALAVQPKVLLLDEPFGALDAQVRKDLRSWLRRLHDDLGITSVFVTHDQEEAMEVADRVVVMNKGHIEQVGTPREIHDNPATPFVYRFLGNVNSFPAALAQGVADLGELRLALRDPLGNGDGIAFVRPHELSVTARPEADSFRAILRHAVVFGPQVKLSLEIFEGPKVEALLPRADYDALEVKNGQEVGVRPTRAQVFAEDGRQTEGLPLLAAHPTRVAIR